MHYIVSRIREIHAMFSSTKNKFKKTVFIVVKNKTNKKQQKTTKILIKIVCLIKVLIQAK